MRYILRCIATLLFTLGSAVLLVTATDPLMRLVSVLFISGSVLTMITMEV